MADRLLLVARVAGAFGVKGEIRITTFTEDPTAIGRYRDLLREDGSSGLSLTSVRPVRAPSSPGRRASTPGTRPRPCAA